MGWLDGVSIETLLGQTLKEIIQNGSDELHFHTVDGKHYRMLHWQDCCESVYIEDVIGDLVDLIGEPILMAEEVSEYGNGEWGSETWTFYKLATIKGSVTIRWYGSSNGYYSESVDFEEVTE